MISIIIVNYNGLKYLRNCLDSVYKTDGDKEIIVIDNGSTDGSRKFLFDEQAQGKITFFDYYLNEGLAVASNKGATFSKGEYLFFLNNDTIVDKNIFTELLKAKVDIAGCKMFNYDGTKELDSNLSVDRFGYPCGKTGRMFYPDGAIFIKRDVFNEIGGFDKKLFLYGEDRDLCWKVYLAGYIVHYIPTAIFNHDSSCVFDTNYKRRYISERNIIRSMLKNYSIGSLLWIIPQYIFWSILELGLLLFINPKAIWKCYLLAYWWNIINLKDTWKEHKKVQAMRKVPDWAVRWFMSRKIGKLFVLKSMGIPKFKERKK